jgi:two-component system nitrate/nitrite response regulator NarL
VVEAAMQAGADGGLLKDVGGPDLSAALRRVLRGERVVDPRIVPSESPRSCGLTRREHEVLRFAAHGKTNPEIAESTGLTRNTVKTYLLRAAQARCAQPGRGHRQSGGGRAA